jgi:serine/threonine protein kinase
VSTPTEIAGRYAIERRLGAGGMSTVFLATDSVLERAVAIKLLAEHLAADDDFVARFRREALSAARLQHPNIVQVFDSGQDQESLRHYIVMEYVDGPSAADLLREDKMLGVEQTVFIVRDACHGLDYAHRAGVIHRDVKPGNLLLSSATGHTKLADFGIAKAAEQTRITQVGSVLGTAAYLSPEQARGDEAGPASDTYSLGVCAYQFLTGRLPHEYSSLTELALKQQQEVVRPIREFRPEVSAELDEAVRLCLEREPGSRYRSALEMAEAIEAGFHGEATDATRRLDLTEVEPATQALPRTSYQPVPAYREPTYVPPARDREEPKRRRGWSTFFALLLVLAAIGAVGAALIASSNGGNGVSPVNEDQVQQQIDGLRQFLQDNTK